MRCGQYKISNRKASFQDSSGGYFFKTTKDVPVLSNICSSASLNASDRPKHHRSCENVRTSQLSTVDIEQRFRSLLVGDVQRDGESARAPNDQWQVGKIVTVPRRSRLRSALSHSALHTLSNNEGMLYGSTSSGYSSSNSSSYGSFKSSDSFGHRHHIDNPIYDITPTTPTTPTTPIATLTSIEDASPIYDIPPLDVSVKVVPGLPAVPGVLDPVTKQCKDYFERRSKYAYGLRKKALKSYASTIIIQDGQMTLRQLTSDAAASPPKTPLDSKIEFLKNEIACLMQQDDCLFKQLLCLHESISTLKVQQSPHTPSCLHSFTEEDEESAEEEDSSDTLDQSHLMSGGKSLKIHVASAGKLSEEEEDEGHCTDLSLDHSSSPSSSLASSHSSSPSSTISSQSSKTSSQRTGIIGSRVYDLPLESHPPGGFTRSRKSYAPTARNRTRSSSVSAPKTPPTMTFGGTTALVVMHTGDEKIFLQDSTPSSLTGTSPLKSGMLQKLQSSYTNTFTDKSSPKKKGKKLYKKSSSVSRVAATCSSHNVASSNQNITRYREALIM